MGKCTDLRDGSRTAFISTGRAPSSGLDSPPFRLGNVTGDNDPTYGQRDLIFGDGGGDDTLEGGSGGDVLTGGNGTGDSLDGGAITDT